MSKSKAHIPEHEKVDGSERYVSVLALWPFWNPRRLRTKRWEQCCGEPMTVVKLRYQERCKICGVVTDHEDHRDFVHCRKYQHVRDVTQYGDMY